MSKADKTYHTLNILLAVISLVTGGILWMLYSLIAVCAAGIIAPSTSQRFAFACWSLSAFCAAGIVALAVLIVGNYF